MKFETHKDFLDSIATHAITVRIEGIGEGMLLDRFGVEMIKEGNSGKKKDETPYEEAKNRLYISKADDKTPIVPKENLTACLIRAGRFMKDGRAQLSTTTDTRITGMLEILEPEIKIIPGPGSPKEGWRPLVAGISVAKGGRQAKSRPCWDTWALDFTLYLMPNPEDPRDPLLSPDRARTLFEVAGARVGLGCWNVIHSGYHGRFTVVKWDLKRIAKKKSA
jgi:hypothetical protein